MPLTMIEEQALTEVADVILKLVTARTATARSAQLRRAMTSFRACVAL